MDLKIVYNMTVIGIAIDRKSHDMIEEIFQSNPTLYYNAYLTGGFATDTVKTIFSIEVEDKMNKLAGILSICLQKGDFLLIEKIIRQISPSLLNFVRKSGSTIDFDAFIQQYKLFENTEEELFTFGTCLVFLAITRQKNCSSSGLLQHTKGKWDLYLRIASLSHADEKLKDKLFPPQAHSEKFICLGYDLWSPHLVEELQSKPLTLEALVSKEIEYRTLHSLGIEKYWSFSGLSSIPVETYQKERNKQLNEGINRYIGCFSRYLSHIGLNSHDILTDIPISKETLEFLFKDFGTSVYYNGVSESEYPLYITATLFIYALSYRYQLCRKQFLNKASEAHYFELKSFEESLKQKESELEILEMNHTKEKKALKTELQNTQKRLKETEQENIKVTKKESKLQTQCEILETKLKDTESLLQSLQIQLAQAQQALANQQTIPLTQKIDWLNKHSIGIGGGHGNIQQLSRRLTQVTYYDSLNENISSIQSLDVMFICTDFISHALANRLKDMSQKFGVPTYYISGTNLELFIDIMYETLQSK